MATSPVFSGVSSYASDLLQVINRAVDIASMPLTLMNNQRQDMSAASDALTALDGKFIALQAALDQVDGALGSSSYSVASSDPASVSAAVSAGAQEGYYSISVSNAGSSTTTVSSASLPAVADPTSGSISAAMEFTLTVDGAPVAITPADGSLASLARAINDASGSVRASLVNVGGSASPQYRLVVRSASLGPVAIQLREGAPEQEPPGADLLDNLTTGAKAVYRLEGFSADIESTSRTVTLAPGLTVDLLQQTSQPVTVTVSRNAESLSSALSGLVDAYNAAVDQLGQQVGPAAGALSGQPILRSLTAALRQITQYTSTSGAVPSLTRIGVALDAHGRLSLDKSALSAQSAAAVASFLGSESGVGFLAAASAALKGVEDPDSGSLRSAIKTAADGLANQDSRISAAQARIHDLQDSLTKQMAAADALLASLESQRDYMNSLFTAMMNNNINQAKNG